MKRIEIIANRSIQEDMFDAFKKAEIVKHYTLYPIVLGVGRSGPRMGDHIWPEENFSLIIYCEEQEAEKIREVIADLKAFFTSEGIKLFEFAY
jgi:Nitrogen regulatory protein P-II